MTRKIVLIVLLSLSIIAIACSDIKTITGSATYLERIALRHGAVFEAILEDTSKADVIATRIGEVRIENRNIPIEFEIPYNSGLIEKGHSYSVRATIKIDNQLWFTTDTHYPVLMNPDDNSVELLLRRVNNNTNTSPPEFGPLGGLPASFAGVLPCADCPGIDYRLYLSPDHYFSLTNTYLDRDTDGGRESSGRWSLSEDGGTLSLDSGSESSQFFSVESKNVLRMLDREGNAIESNLNYEIRRITSPE
jgi:copper homeostasis protein (lipoprotein)